MSKARFWALLLNIVFGVVALACLPLMLLSVFMFDDPAAADNKLVWFTAASFPGDVVIYAVSLGLSIVARVTKKERLLLIAALLPILGIAWIMSGFILLESLCNGNFGCLP